MTRPTILSKQNIFLCIIIFLIFSLSKSYESSTKVILCLGDSITEGIGASDVTGSYPAILQRYLDIYSSQQHIAGDSYDFRNSQSNWQSALSHKYRCRIVNLAVGGTTMIRSFKRAYIRYQNCSDSLSYSIDPMIIIMGFGTNDANHNIWNEMVYRRDYILTIQSYQAKYSSSKICLLIPPPCEAIVVNNIQRDTINVKLHDIIIDIANVTGSSVIDLLSPLGGSSFSRRYMFYNDYRSPSSKLKEIKRRNAGYEDGLHPNDIGYLAIAHTVASSFMGSDNANRVREQLYEKDAYIHSIITDEMNSIKEYNKSSPSIRI